MSRAQWVGLGALVVAAVAVVVVARVRSSGDAAAAQAELSDQSLSDFVMTQGLPGFSDTVLAKCGAALPGTEFDADVVLSTVENGIRVETVVVRGTPWDAPTRACVAQTYAGLTTSVATKAGEAFSPAGRQYALDVHLRFPPREGSFGQ